ncbi:hypothetical protein N9383_03240 [Granulosicoccus sp.]|nr:hypothetical protein [Granulosicoccus sp.]
MLKLTDMQQLYENVRSIALNFSDVYERDSHGAPCIFLDNKKPLCYFHNNRKGTSGTALWCPPPAGDSDDLVTAEPEKYSKPATSTAGAFSNWVCIKLDREHLDWTEVATILEAAFELNATRQQLANYKQ